MPRTHIQLWTGENIPVADLIATLSGEGRTYIVQGQTIARLPDHPKPHSLDYWLRTRSRHPDTKLADNKVVKQLVETGLFALQGNLTCPDSGKRCKGLVLKHSRSRVPGEGRPRSRSTKSATMDSQPDVASLGNAITKLAREHVSKKNDWYQWREINEHSLPAAITLPRGNQYEKNVALKKLLNREIRRTTTNEGRQRLFRYYVSTWGGIHSNSEETLEFYARASANELIERGTKGIASWSKVLSICEPDEFAIFDARVSASLNALQIIHNVADKQRFPILASRNKIINMGNNLLKRQNWRNAPTRAFYRTYLSYLKNTVTSLDAKLGAAVATIEMLLFAKAEDLLREAFPNQRF